MKKTAQNIKRRFTLNGALALKNEAKGFTLIELLVVIGILAVLLAITLIAINPAKQFSQANNTKRQSDVNAILNAVNQYAADNRGALPTGISTSSATIMTGGADLCSALVPKYIAALPGDPTTSTGSPYTNCGASYNTHYTIQQSSSNARVTVGAPDAELGTSISVTR